MSTSPRKDVVLVLVLTNVLWTLAAVWPSPGAQAGTATVFFEDFESGQIGPRWTRFDGNPASGLDFWNVTSYRSNTGTYSAWSAQDGTQQAGGLNNSDIHQYDNDMQADLAVDLRVSGFTSLTLTFYFWSRSESGGGDFIRVYVEAGGVQSAFFNNTGGTGNQWVTTSVAVPTNIERLMFRFQTDSANNNFEGAYVDDILLTGVEDVPPTSSVNALLPYTNLGIYMIPYTAQDGVNESGVAYVELWYRLGTSGPFSLYNDSANPTGQWTGPTIPFDPDFAQGDGYYEFYTIAVDNAQNAEAAPGVPDASMTVDRQAPTVQITEPGAQSLLHSGTLTFTWTASDTLSGIDHYEVWLDGQAPQTLTATSFTATGIADGPHTFHVAAVDRAGNRQEASVSFRVNTDAWSFEGPYGGLPWYLILAAVAAVVLFLFFLWRRKKDREETTPTEHREEKETTPEPPPSS